MSKNTALSLKENQPLKEKIAAILKRIADAVEKFFKGDKDLKLSAHNRYAQTFLDDVQALRDMEELVSKGFETARENKREFGERKSGGQRFAKGKKKQHYAKQGGEWSEALTGAEWAKYNNAITSGVDAGLRISDNSILVECENDNIYQYKLVVYDSTFKDNPINAIYAISNIDYNIDDARMIASEIDDLEVSGYEQKYAKKILRSIAKVHKIFLGKYNSKNPSFSRIGNNAPQNRANPQIKSNGTAVITTAGKIKDSDRLTQSDNAKYSKDDMIVDLDDDADELLFTSDDDLSFDAYGTNAGKVINVEQLMQEQVAEHG